METFKKWLKKAKNDLLSAKKLSESGIYDTAAYHTQQCAEKTLKAYLAFKQQPNLKTHDLDELITTLNKVDGDFEKLRTPALNLTSYSTEFRYPGDEEDEPSASEVQDAIKFAEEILNFVLLRIK